MWRGNPRKFDSGGRAAVHGGIATLIPYIGAMKAWGVQANLWEAVNYFIDEGDNSSIVDFGLHCSLIASAWRWRGSYSSWLGCTKLI